MSYANVFHLITQRCTEWSLGSRGIHDDVIKWKHFPRYWPFLRSIHPSLVNSAHKGQWRGALMFYLICAWINGWVNNREAGELRRNRTHHDVTEMFWQVYMYYLNALFHYQLILSMNEWDTNPVYILNFLKLVALPILRNGDFACLSHRPRRMVCFGAACQKDQIMTRHYDDVIMGTIASQITSLTIVYSIVYSGADQSKHQSSTSLAFVWGIPRTNGQ